MTEKKSKTELRKFGFVMAGALALFGGLAYWREHRFGPWLIGISLAFLLFGLLAPTLLRPVERAWMALAHVLGTVMTYVILTLTFILVFTPLGLVLRLFGKDLLSLKIDRKATTYWSPAEPDGPAGRPGVPY